MNRPVNWTKGDRTESIVHPLWRPILFGLCSHMHNLNSKCSATHTSVRLVPCSNLFCSQVWNKTRFFSNWCIFQKEFATSSVTLVDGLGQKSTAFPGRYICLTNGPTYCERRRTATLHVHNVYYSYILSVHFAKIFPNDLVIFSESKWRKI